MRRQRYLLCSGLVLALFSCAGYADQDVDITATVINNTCHLEVGNNGVVRLPTVQRDYFADDVTAETDYPGGKEFSIQLIDCPVSDGKISQVTINFSPQVGAMPAGNAQVFANDLAASDNGAKNVGLAIFSSQADTPRANVLNSDGTTRAIYPVTAENYKNSLWTFYARMQRILNTETITSGLLTTNVMVIISYQ
ncbi:fimbrial protein [Salmonella enterica]|nr:fimbrial protein [Salmonella enterica]